MIQNTTDTVTDLDWMAVEKGDKAKARERMFHFAGSLLMGENLSRTDRIRLASALIGYKGDPVAFFGYGRRGPSAKKTRQKVEVWRAVKAEKEKLKADGKKQDDVFANVAEDRDMKEGTVKDWYDEVQRYLKQYKKSSAAMTEGIASLLP